MKQIFSYLLMLLVFALACSSPNNNDPSGRVIRTGVPERPAGQKDVLGLTAPKIDTVRVGFIGLGMRGPGAVKRFTHIPGTRIVALCDLYAEKVEKTQAILEKAGLPRAEAYSGSEEAWKELVRRDDID
ncbi:MAG: glycosyl hydrolase, partial [Proteiniphilum sp.]